MWNDMYYDQNNGNEIEHNKDSHGDSYKIVDYVLSKPTDFITVQLSDMKWAIRIETSSKGCPCNRDEEGDDEKER